MRHLLLSIVFFLSACQSLPVQRNFTTLPPELSSDCPELGKIHDNAKLSDVVRSVVENYSLYHSCRLKHNSMVEWYNKQKEIFESVKID